MDAIELKKQVELGLSVTELAGHFNCGRSTVAYWLRKTNTKTKNKSFTELKAKYRCGLCGSTDPSVFYGHKKSVCGSCHNDYTKKLGSEKRLKAVNMLGGKCASCSFDKYSFALDFHHVNGGEDKDPDFSNMRYWSWERIEQELEKCVLLCAICHRAVHNGVLSECEGVWLPNT